jgi:hypothetical protein
VHGKALRARIIDMYYLFAGSSARGGYINY